MLKRLFRKRSYKIKTQSEAELIFEALAALKENLQLTVDAKDLPLSKDVLINQEAFYKDHPEAKKIQDDFVKMASKQAIEKAQALQEKLFLTFYR